MAKTPWIPAAVALTLSLGLAGCGDAEEPAEAPAQQDEAPATEPQVDIETEPSEPATPPPASEDAMPPAEGVQANGDPAQPPEAGAGGETGTLGGSPDATLDEGGALPGEPTRSDIDAILEETERRFEQAQREIDEQYEEVEQEGTALEPMEESTDFRSTLEPMQIGDPGTTSAIDEEAERRGEVTQSDIDALLEETERRFEEAQRQLDEQFEEAERREPRGEPPSFDTQ